MATSTQWVRSSIDSQRNRKLTKLLFSRHQVDFATHTDIRDFRWHDLRHTWASWHVQAGTGLQELMELGGWSSYQMVLRYAHLGARICTERQTIFLQSSYSRTWWRSLGKPRSDLSD